MEKMAFSLFETLLDMQKPEKWVYKGCDGSKVVFYYTRLPRQIKKGVIY